jgi:hypothetical protein
MPIKTLRSWIKQIIIIIIIRGLRQRKTLCFLSFNITLFSILKLVVSKTQGHEGLILDILNYFFYEIFVCT